MCLRFLLSNFNTSLFNFYSLYTYIRIKVELEMNIKNKPPVSDQSRMQQNRKILRYRASLSQLAIVCVNLKHLNGEYLSMNFCQYFKDKLKNLQRLHKSIKDEINRQLLAGCIQKSNKKHNIYYSSSHALANQRFAPLRAKFLMAIHGTCDTILSELHFLNYEYISDHTYAVLGELIDIYGELREKIAKEREEQSQRRVDTSLENVS